MRLLSKKCLFQLLLYWSSLIDFLWQLKGFFCDMDTIAQFFYNLTCIENFLNFFLHHFQVLYS